MCPVLVVPRLRAATVLTRELPLVEREPAAAL
jgi:hypothetical protein